MNSRNGTGVPIEHFIQALTSQLDRAQTAMAAKARAGLPLTFAVRDLSLDLRAHVDVDGATVRIRPAGPGETETSTIRLALTTITRPMMEENTRQLSADPDEVTLADIAGDELSSDDLRRLEWAGVQTVSQLRQVGEQAIERVADVPAMRLRAALSRAAEPMVRHVISEPNRDSAPEAPPLFRVQGHNLLAGGPPAVRMNGEDVPVLHASRRELLLAPLAHQLGGDVTIEPAPGHHVRVSLPAAPPASAKGAAV